MIRLAYFDLLGLRYFLHSSRDEAAWTAGQRGLGIVLCDKAKAAVLDRILVSGRLCAVKL